LDYSPDFNQLARAHADRCCEKNYDNTNSIYPKSYSAVWLIAVAHLKRINATTIGASLILQKNGILSMAKACTAGFCE
jgi:hypothetical protein